MKRIVLILLLFYLRPSHALPENFVYLHELAPEIIEEIRYASSNNFMGQPAPGYVSPRCVLSRPAALQLKQAQEAIRAQGYTIKVYDCYRPQQAVNAFYTWAQDMNDTRMKEAFYPSEIKEALFSKGYIALHSGHTRGSTVDLTLVKLPQANSTQKPEDNAVDMGTPFDFFDERAAVFYPKLAKEQKNNRMLLRKLMIANGFIPYEKEWWHFTLKNEPYPETYFNFSVQ
ncbi:MULTISPECIES: M15 family metallopeptidase [Legionella]|uniref:M15 family metallopeptidase n=1 Tax=Legionella TaxID=445 RepID=UPI000F8CD19F|nr:MULTISPECIES: M15 family metallopeptidase [Legionella]MCP0913992.1 M15 family metallopeptidase [Legionella sp. 27cVA30]RUR10700.1 D-alanyl-D-alanine dipeptidase [Legionella septentrionalis]RUR16547.1 D-alanyl-D-alanine dipeptidase [Legionella septentrionalis]